MKKNKDKKVNKEKSFKFSLMNILGNNRVLMVLSILIAFGLWIWIAIEKSPEVEQVITGVPVQINLSNSIPEQLNLQIFGKTNYTVDVTVKGKKYILSNLNTDDLVVEANVNYVDSPGIKTLQLRVSPKNESTDFNISSVSETYIEVFFDTYKEIEMPLNGEILHSISSIVPEGCIKGDLVLSTGKVTVSGPATEINRITSVKATAAVDEILTKTTTFDPKIELVTNDGTPLEYSSINTEEKNITMTVPVLKVVTLPTAVEFKNVPAYFVSNPLPVTVSPSSVSVAIPVEAIETTKSFVVGTVDFAEISNTRETFNVNASSINSFKITDPTVKQFKIKVNASSFETKTLTVPASSVVVKNSRNDFTVRVDSGKDIAVTLVGPKEELDKFTASNIVIELDTADKTISADTKILPGRVIISDTDRCWAVGKYDIRITATPIK